MDFQQVTELAATSGLIYFIVIFIGVLVYALRPGAKKTFDAAARIPLRDE